ncbi:MAG: 50S ribosomal protein L18 [Candidatus Pelagibacter sp.]
MKLSTLQRKKFRVRNKLKNNSKNDRYRLSVSRSLKNISAQIIDDANSKTVLSASSNEKGMKPAKNVNKTELSKLVAEKLAKKAGEKNIKKIYFDRGQFKYHGRVKIFAETLRKNGMEF